MRTVLVTGSSVPVPGRSGFTTSWLTGGRDGGSGVVVVELVVVLGVTVVVDFVSGERISMKAATPSASTAVAATPTPAIIGSVGGRPRSMSPVDTRARGCSSSVENGVRRRSDD